jgi:thiamine-monophosphate kinase
VAGQDRESPEDRLIARFFKPLATHPGALGLADDTAFVSAPEGSDLVLTTDAVVAGVHFLPGDPPGMVARKALRVNLSDLAAKGARPLGFLLSLAIAAETGEKWLQAFSDGLKVDCEEFGVALFGGDTVRTPGPVTISVFALGALPRRTMARRAGAKAGDRVFVSGSVGDGALGLRLHRERALAARWKLSEAAADHLRMRYQLPQPRVRLAEAVRDHASASMDISDGLAGDLAKLCRVSGVSATIEVARVPLSDGARAAIAADNALTETILTGGDDYEILCTVPAERAGSFVAAAGNARVAVTEIGEVVSGDAAPVFRDANGKALTFTRPSFSHF